MLKMFIYASTLIIIINLAYFLIKEKSNFSREKFTCYECGFESKIRSRIPFSLRFFTLTIVYLLFDIEVMMAFSYLYSIYFNTTSMLFYSFIFFCLATLYLEWIEGSLDWIR